MTVCIAFGGKGKVKGKQWALLLLGSAKTMAISAVKTHL